MLQVLLFAAWLTEATSQITGYGNTVVAYGGVAHYTCKLSNPTGVLQVTWQRTLRETAVENLASYSELYGEKVNEPFLGKVTLTEAALNSTSISVRDVTWQDESCYICSFNAFPDGSQQQQTCLTVQGISLVNTSCSPRPAPKGQVVEFHCSATGKPKPTIRWDVSKGGIMLNQSQAMVVANDDRTFTSSSVVTLQIPAGVSGHVDCLIKSGQTGEKLERIPFPVDTSWSPDKNGERPFPWMPALILTALVLTSCIIVYVVVKKKDRLRCSKRNGFIL